MGNNTVYGAYAQGDNADNRFALTPGIDTGYDAWEVVGVHSMSKQTLVYLGYGQISPDENDTDEPSAWALGMKHLF